MRLKALELHGFKSFADPIRLEFPGRITAIVGPNGSGKSNIAEAIRWALGEQSMSTLRVRRGEDLIFAGSDQRPRSGMSEVTLIFDNSDGELPLEFAEVALTRRAYRDGEGEYLLNGNRVRLRDIQELLGSTPLARRTYAVIGQGMVDEVLRMRPEERRAMFEEAAGIALYRMKREEALRRLEATRQNLTRARDLLAELTPRLNSLRRQAERAQQYEALRSQLKAQWRRWAARRMVQLRRSLEIARAALAEAESAWVQHQAQQAAVEQHAAMVREEIRRRRAQLSEIEARWEKLREEAASARRQWDAAEEALQALARRKQARREQIEAVRARQVALEAMRGTLGAEREALEIRIRELRAQREAAEARYGERRARYEELRRQAEELQRAIHELEEEASRIARYRSALQSLQQELEEAASKRRALWERRARERADRQQEWERLQAERQALQGTLEALAQQRARVRRQLEEAEAELARAREALAQARAQEDYLRAYAETLARRPEGVEGLEEDLQRVLSAGIPGVIGRLVDWVELEPGWEAAAIVLLGPLLQALVVRDLRAVEQVRPLVRHGLPVVVLEALRFERPLPRHRRVGIPLPRTDRRPGWKALPFVRPAASILRARAPRLHAWLAQRLENIWLAETWEQAMAVWGQLPRSAQVLTQEGGWVSGEGVLWIGRFVAPEVIWLAREQAWRSLPDQIEAARRASRQAEEALRASQSRWAQQREQLVSLEASYQAAEARRGEIERRLGELEETLKELSQSLQALEREEAEAENRRAQIERELQEIARRAQELAEKHHELEEARSRVEQEMVALRLEEAAEELARMRSEERWLEERFRQLVEMIAQNEEALRALETEWTTRSEEEDDEERAALEVERERWRTLHQELAARLQELETQRAQAMTALLAAESAFEEVWKQAEVLRESGKALEERLHSARVEVVRQEGELLAFQRALQEEWRHLDEGEIDWEKLGSEAIDEEEPLEVLEAEVESLRRSLRRLGPIHPEAAAEYAELQERHAFLTTQIADLEAAAASLQQTIEALDQQMHQAFMETFRKVGRAFKETFSALFGGGNARLVLTEAERWDQAGVEIFVRVPGKRTQSLTMLSGGEKALTAIALIFALLQVRPSPFVILDEADAALDEANIGRFREMLRRLAERTQFILITHNRGTVEVADVLYGVTLRPDGSSQVLSLRLEEAERMIA